ncbi:MAG: prepilin-type N-terminal cleavage/methylation domain-containing protein [Rhodocyclaceae bacterium]|nr:prepilin-type N-terminal cleavage/methylation domain-containing protein [Rhodocyclaceae bacterium]
MKTKSSFSSNIPRLASPRSEEGFSLVEVLLSLVLLTIVMLLTVNLMMSEIQGNHSGRSFTEATSIATDMVEKLMEVDYTDLTDFDGYDTTEEPPGLEPALSYCGEWRQWIRNELPRGYGEIDIVYETNLSRIEVLVRFEDAAGVREVKLATMRNNVL